MKWRSLLMAVAALIVFSSCENKDLCDDHDHLNYIRVRVNVDWSQFLPKEIPTGMSVVMYPTDMSHKPFVELTNNISYAILRVPVGEYSLLVYNQSPPEFGSFNFVDTDQFAKLHIAGRKVQTRWYQTRDDNETVIAEPEWLGIDVFRTITLTPEMEEMQDRDDLATRQDSIPRDLVIASAHQRNVISTLTVRVHLKGIYNLRSARASITGMAAGYVLGEEHPSSDEATQLLEEWSVTTDSSDPTQGVISAKITTFGIPYGHQGIPEENLFRLQLLLIDGTTVKDFPFSVGDLLRAESEGESTLDRSLVLDLSIDEPLPDVKPEGGSSSGFDAIVDDWGEEEEVDVGI